MKNLNDFVETNKIIKNISQKQLNEKNKQAQNKISAIPRIAILYK